MPTRFYTFLLPVSRRDVGLLLAVLLAHGAALLMLAGIQQRQPALPSADIAIEWLAPAAARLDVPSPDVKTPQPATRPTAKPTVAETPAPVHAVETPSVAEPAAASSAPPAAAPAAKPVNQSVALPAAGAVPVSLPRFDAAYLQNPAPAYPALSRRLGEEGKVLLRVLVSEGGRAERVEISQTSGSARLDEAAREAVRGWRFVPARQGERSTAAWVIVPINFSLQG